jgi:hypothetical protein
VDIFDRPALVSIALEKAGKGWKRNLHDVPRAIQTWNIAGLGNMGLNYVADGRANLDSNGNLTDMSYSRKGRGTTCIDLARETQVNDSLIRVDMLSIKTDSLTKSGGFPSKIEVSTGKPDTLNKVIEAVNNGASLPTLIWASSGDTSNPSHEGFALFLDIAAIIRSHGIVDGTFSKGKAPIAWRRFGSRRNCGATSAANKHALKMTGRPSHVGAWQKRQHLEFPHIDSDGCMWSTPWFKHYPQLFVNIGKKHLQAQGLAWVPCNIADLPALVEKQDWNTLGY